MDRNKKTIMNHLNANIPLLTIGKSGWGKSAIIEQTCKELNLPVVMANANSWSAEDFGGIPRPIKDKYYEYLPPKWVIDFQDREFVLFIDEMNQASVPVLHALYRVVHEREVAGVKLPRMKVLAAGNLSEENPYLTDIPEPLLKRFSVYQWELNHTTAKNFLNAKYGVGIQEIVTNPRQTEMAIQLFRVGEEHCAGELAGQQVLQLLKNVSFVSEGKKLVRQIEIDEVKKRNGLL